MTMDYSNARRRRRRQSRLRLAHLLHKHDTAVAIDVPRRVELNNRSLCREQYNLNLPKLHCLLGDSSKMPTSMPCQCCPSCGIEAARRQEPMTSSRQRWPTSTLGCYMSLNDAINALAVSEKFARKGFNVPLAIASLMSAFEASRSLP